MARDDVPDLAESLEQKSGGDDAQQPIWSALARVEDDDPIFVFSDGPSNGITVTCRILLGDYAGARVTALLSTEVGASFASHPIRKGMRVLIDFVEGHLRGVAVVARAVPGGEENPIPEAMAGVKIAADTLANEELIAPPKGCNFRAYIRGGAFIVRLKGDGSKNKADGTPFVGEFFVEADDGTPAAPGTPAVNSAIRLALNPSTGKMAFKAKTEDGAEVSINDGVVSMTSPNGLNTIQVSDSDVRVMGSTFYVDVATVMINGTCVGINVPPGLPFAGVDASQPSAWIGGNVALGGVVPPFLLPVNGVAYSVAGPANVISTHVVVAP